MDNSNEDQQDHTANYITLIEDRDKEIAELKNQIEELQRKIDEIRQLILNAQHE